MSVTNSYRTAVRSWARALANLEAQTSENASMWTGFEMGVREAMFSMSIDLGWSDAEWDAVEVAAQQLSQRMIETSN